jgi:hypothetical protein
MNRGGADRRTLHLAAQIALDRIGLCIPGATAFAKPL